MLYIPNKIKIGYQNRSNTYTGKLAYIIYTDEKGKLRKESSWNSWRDSKIEPQEFENTPIEGFVLNKKVGDYSGHWGNHRKAYTRIFDPRGFEFEITIENLLFILENCTSTKGKGLEGEFVYSWSGKDLVLLPTSSPDYITIKSVSTLINTNNPIKAKDLIVGATYATKQDEELVYIGRFNKYEIKYNTSTSINKGKHYYFAEVCERTDGDMYYYIKHYKSINNKFIKCVDSDSSPYYADIFDTVESSTYYSPIDESKSEYIPYTLDEFNELLISHPYRQVKFFDKDKRVIYVERDYGASYRIRCIDFEYYYGTNRMTPNELFNKFAPMYKINYLTNGKLYKNTKNGDM